MVDCDTERMSAGGTPRATKAARTSSSLDRVVIRHTLAEAFASTGVIAVSPILSKVPAAVTNPVEERNAAARESRGSTGGCIATFSVTGVTPSRIRAWDCEPFSLTTCQSVARDNLLLAELALGSAHHHLQERARVLPGPHKCGARGVHETRLEKDLAIRHALCA